MNFPHVKIDFPAWVGSFADWEKPCITDDERMRLAIDLALENVRQATGGPFGAAIFAAETGKILSIGINQVVRLNNSCLHAETTAIMAAQEKLKSHNLNFSPAVKYELFTSCEPCAMCLGAILWSGVSRIVCAATKEDASAVGFDEGPVYESSYEYLQSRGIAVKRNLMRGEAVEAFDLYRATGGVIYNR